MQCERERSAVLPSNANAQPIRFNSDARPMNRSAASGDLRAEGGPRIAKMTKDEMVKGFKSAPKSSRHHRMLCRPQHRAPHCGYRGSWSPGAVGCPDGGQERAAG